jgi:radical SAM superfamily enzyme
MTEYWVSQSKYYCKFCKQWMADNKATRQLHDLSEKHKSQVEYFHKKKSDDKLHGAR